MTDKEEIKRLKHENKLLKLNLKDSNKDLLLARNRIMRVSDKKQAWLDNGIANGDARANWEDDLIWNKFESYIRNGYC